MRHTLAFLLILGGVLTVTGLLGRNLHLALTGGALTALMTTVYLAPTRKDQR